MISISGCVESHTCTILLCTGNFYRFGGILTAFWTPCHTKVRFGCPQGRLPVAFFSFSLTIKIFLFRFTLRTINPCILTIFACWFSHFWAGNWVSGWPWRTRLRRSWGAGLISWRRDRHRTMPSSTSSTGNTTTPPGYFRSVFRSRSRILSVQWIRTRNPDPDPESGGQKWPTKIEKSYEISCFEVLDVLFWGLKASPVAWTSFWRPRISNLQFLNKKMANICVSCKSFWFFGHKNPGSVLDPDLYQDR